jgi:hypothetical protein
VSLQPHEIKELCEDLRIQGWCDEVLEEVRQALTRQPAPSGNKEGKPC